MHPKPLAFTYPPRHDGLPKPACATALNVGCQHAETPSYREEPYASARNSVMEDEARSPRKPRQGCYSLAKKTV